MDVGACAKPLQDCPGAVSKRLGPHQPPSIGTVGAAQAAFDTVSTGPGCRLMPGIVCALAVVWMEWFDPTVAQAFFKGETGVIHPLLIKIDVPAIRSCDPDDLWHGFSETAKLCEAGLQRRCRFDASGDVLGHDNDTCNLTAFVEMRHLVSLHPQPFAVGVSQGLDNSQLGHS